MFWFILLILMIAYAPCSIGLSLPLKRKWRPVVALLLFFLTIFFQGMLFFAGLLPRAALLPAAWISGMLIFSTPLFFLRDLTLLGLHLAKRRIPNQKYVIAGILAVAGTLAAWGEYCAVTPPRVKHLEIAIPGLPDGLDGFKAVYLSDIHICKTSAPNYLWTVVCRTNALHPDVVLLGGDLGDLKPEEIKPNMHQLGDLHAKYGVFSAPGNHEYFRGFDDWIAFLDSVGIESLPNRHAVIEHNGEKLVIAGLTDEEAKRRWNTKYEIPDIDKALAGAPAGAPVILLAHRPRLARDYAAHGVSLQLSGHTHGGMVAGLPALLVKIANKGFVSGLYQVGGMKLYVSNGAGLWNGFLFRLGVPSEITEIVLRSPETEQKTGDKKEPVESDTPDNAAAEQMETENAMKPAGTESATPEETPAAEN